MAASLGSNPTPVTYSYSESGGQNQIGSEFFTMPEDGTFTDVYFRAQGYTADTPAQGCIWGADGTLLAAGAPVNLSTWGGETDIPWNDSTVNALIPAGTQIRFGFWRPPGNTSVWAVGTGQGYASENAPSAPGPFTPGPASDSLLSGFFVNGQSPSGEVAAAPYPIQIISQYANGPDYTTYTPPVLSGGRTLMVHVGACTTDQATTIGNALVAAGQPNAIIRIMWEFNISGWAWSGMSDTDYVAAFNEAAAAFLAVSPSFVIVWCPNDTDTIPTSYYPAAENVTWIGMDLYDFGGYASSGAALVSFGATKGLPLIFPEWGLNDTDDTEYTNYMIGLITDPSNNFAAHDYFSATGPESSYLPSFPDSEALIAAAFSSTGGSGEGTAIGAYGLYTPVPAVVEGPVNPGSGSVQTQGPNGFFPPPPLVSVPPRAAQGLEVQVWLLGKVAPIAVPAAAPPTLGTQGVWVGDANFLFGVTADGQMIGPYPYPTTDALAVDADENLYAFGDEFVQVTPENVQTVMPGTPAIGQSSGAVASTPDGSMWAANAYPNQTYITRIDTNGDQFLLEVSPTAVAEDVCVGSDGNLYISGIDTANQFWTVWQMSAEGELLNTWVMYDTATDSFENETMICAGPDGRLWTAAYAFPGYLAAVTTDGTVSLYTGFSGTWYDLCAGPDANVYGTALTDGESAVQQITPEGVVNGIASPDEVQAGTVATYICLGPDSRLWCSSGGSWVFATTTEGVISGWDFAPYGITNTQPILAFAGVAPSPGQPPPIVVREKAHMTMLDILQGASSTTITVGYDGPGSGSFQLQSSDPKATNGNLALGNVVKVVCDGVVAGAYFIEEPDDILMDSSDVSNQLYTIQGRTLEAVLDMAVVHPSWWPYGSPPNVTLTTALTDGTAITSLTVTPLNAPIQDQDQVIVTSGGNSDTYTAAGNCPPGSTVIPIQSVTPSFTYPVGSVVTDGTVGTVTYTAMPGGAILVAELQAAQARMAGNAYAPLNFLTWDFDAIYDSNGDPWQDSQTVTVNIGTTITQLAQTFAALALDFWVDDEMVMHAVAYRGYDRTKQVIFHAGHDITSSNSTATPSQIERVQHLSGLDTRMLVQGSSQQSETQDQVVEAVNSAIEQVPGIGIREGFMNYAASNAPGQMLAAGLAGLETSEQQVDPLTVPVAHGTAPGLFTPFYHYGIGDDITIDLPVSEAQPLALPMYTGRIVALTVAQAASTIMGSGSQYDVTISLDSIPYEVAERLAGLLQVAGLPIGSSALSAVATDST